jgi:glycosyltransferase involved in cell wall biosynthesis
MLALALHSALYQREVDLEVIVVDDGSTDDTATWVSGAADPRVRVVRNPIPQGVSAARNRGITEADGAWVAFLDDDDLWAPDKLALQLDAVRRSGCHWVYAGNVSVDDELQVLGGRHPPAPDHVMASLVRHDSVPAGASNVMVNAHALRDVGPFDTGLSTSEDWDMWLRLARGGPPAWVPRPLVACRVHRDNASRDTTKMLNELRLIERRHSIPLDWPGHLRWAAWMSLDDGRRWDAVGYYARALLHGDVGSLARAGVAILGMPVGSGFPPARRRSDDLPWTGEAKAWLAQIRP